MDRDDSTRCKGALEAASVLAGGAVLVTIAFGTLFYFEPRIDLVAATPFARAGAKFIGETAIVETVRDGFKLLYILACAAAMAGVIACIRWKREVLGFNFTKWMYLVLCLGIGPGVVCNLGFKDEWGRARPKHIVEFGGEKAFTSPLSPTDQCDTNCSFVCGESSSMFMVFFALACVARRRRGALIASGVAAGLAVGIVRMSQGGHFLSDVIFSGIMMALVAACIFQLIVAIESEARKPAPDNDFGSGADGFGRVRV